MIILPGHFLNFLIQISFDSHLSLAYSMRFEPVHFGQSYPTIGKAHIGNSFQLSPAALPYRFLRILRILTPGPTAIVSTSLIFPTISKCIKRTLRNRARDQEGGACGQATNQRGLQSAARGAGAGESTFNESKYEQRQQR